MTRDVGDDPMTAILQPSACVSQPAPHPGVDVLLQTKGEVPFDSLMTALLKLFFPLVLPLIWLTADC
jgi:hypothetical protein